MKTKFSLPAVAIVAGAVYSMSGLLAGAAVAVVGGALALYLNRREAEDHD